MEPDLYGNETFNNAVAPSAKALFDIPLDPADDDEIAPPYVSDNSDTDVWAGVEAPEEAEAEAVSVETPAVAAFTAAVMPDISLPHAAIEEVASLGDEREVEPDEEPEKGGWLVSFLCAGVGIIAICLLLPLAEENHQLAWQREKLKTDLAQLQQQVQVNDEFLKKISNDPTLAERLAQRQMKFIRQGTTILDLPGGAKEEMSPFQLVTLPPPNPIPPYQPLGGALSAVIRNSHLRLYLTGAGLLLLAAGLVLGGESKQTYDPQ